MSYTRRKLCCLQVQVSLAQYLSHVHKAATVTVHPDEASGSAVDMGALMTQLSELDQMGQDGASPVDEAEVMTAAMPPMQYNSLCK